MPTTALASGRLEGGGDPLILPHRLVVNDVGGPAEELAAKLRGTTTALVVFDCRSAEDFARLHVIGAHHLNLPTLLLKRLRKGTLAPSSLIGDAEAREAFSSAYPDKVRILVAADEGSEVGELLSRRLREDGADFSLLHESVSSFGLRYPECVERGPGGVPKAPELLPLADDFRALSVASSDACSSACCPSNLSSSSAFSPESPASAFPGRLNLDAMSVSVPLSPSAMARVQAAELCYKSSAWRGNDGVLPIRILPHLYLGNAGNAADRPTLEAFGIRYILNVTPDLPNSFEEEDGFHYLQLGVADHWSQNLAAHFPEAIAFIEEARAGGGVVLVHCLAGISRSVTVTLAYLMARAGKSLDSAYELVKAAKPNIAPNFNFMGQLLDWERSLAASPDSGRASASSAEDEAPAPVLLPPPIFLSPTITLAPPPFRKSGATPTPTG